MNLNPNPQQQQQQPQVTRPASAGPTTTHSSSLAGSINVAASSAALNQYQQEGAEPQAQQSSGLIRTTNTVSIDSYSATENLMTLPLQQQQQQQQPSSSSQVAVSANRRVSFVTERIPRDAVDRIPSQEVIQQQLRLDAEQEERERVLRQHHLQQQQYYLYQQQQQQMAAASSYPRPSSFERIPQDAMTRRLDPNGAAPSTSSPTMTRMPYPPNMQQPSVTAATTTSNGNFDNNFYTSNFSVPGVLEPQRWQAIHDQMNNQQQPSARPQ